MLATIDVEKAIDADGKEITPEVELTNGLTSHPKHFECRMKPRSQSSIDMILA
jgi:hypothetical protein